MYKYFLKQLLRQPIKVAILIISLSLSGIVFCFGVVLLLSATHSITQAKTSFTTIAVPNLTTLIKASGFYDATRSRPVTSEDWIRNNAGEKSFLNLYQQLVQKSEEYRNVKNDFSKSYFGYSPIITPLTSRMANYKEVNPQRLDVPYNYAIFVATCFEFEDVEVSGSLTSSKSLKLIWKVDEVVSLHQGYNKPQYMMSGQSTISFLSNNNSSFTLLDYFDMGKQYILLGKFSDNRLIMKPKEENRIINPKDMEYLKDDSSLPTFDIFSAMPAVNEQGELIYSEEDGNFKIENFPYAEITEDLESFLSSEEGNKWERIINSGDIILHSAYVVPTDNIQSIVSFNQYTSTVVNGRYITQNEYDNGENVCMISKKFADYNKLQVGDTIPLSLHTVYHHTAYNPAGNVPTWYTNLFPYDIKLSDQKEYKVVGIYQTPEWSDTPYSLSPNTIIVPSNSIESAPVSSEKLQFLLTSGLLFGTPLLAPPSSAIITIDSNKLDKIKLQLEAEIYSDYNESNPISGEMIFENKINKEDIKDFFVFYDQGYSAVAATLKDMSIYSVIILIFCILVWCATLCFFIYTFIFKQRRELGILLSLGLSRKKTLKQLFTNCIIIGLIAVMITGSVVFISMEHMVDQVYSMFQKSTPIEQAFSDVSIGTANQGVNEFSGETDTTVKAGELFRPVKPYWAICLALGIQIMIYLIIIRAVSKRILRQRPLKLLQSRESQR